MTALPDDDLASILAEIGEPVEPEPVEPEPVEPEPEPEPISAPTISDPVSNTEESTLTEPENSSDTPEGELNLNIVYNESVTELLTNYRKDREDIDSFMTLLYDRINGSANASRVYFETLAMSLRTRSEANNNLIKLIDNINKRSSKSDNNFDLEDLLGDNE